MNLSTLLENIRGVGPKTFEHLSLAGLRTVGDIITYFPRDYEDFSMIRRIVDIKPGNVMVKAMCESVNTKTVRRGMKITTATLKDESGKIHAVWFNQPYREKQLQPDNVYIFSGEFEFRYNRYQLTNPHAELVGDIQENGERFIPIYRSASGLKSQVIRTVLKELKPFISQLPESLPGDIVSSEHLVSRAQALLAIHFPDNDADIARARQRLAFEELFQIVLASQLNKQEISRLEGWHIPFDQGVVRSFVEKLPFTLTDSQRIAAWEILQDFEKATPMNRLLQGDVGSGKTVVAGLAARQVAHEGLQTAFMAPTEILAVQHATTLQQLLAPFGVTVGLLTGSVKGSARDALYEAISNGDLDVVVGTHALIQSKVHFSRLGFVVIDEQHRFGVSQRQELLKKSLHMPHLLAMTATPIPRSLALTLYGELDVSVLTEKPTNRLPIKTKIWSPNSRPQLYARVDKQLSLGRQAYVICKLIDNNPDNEFKSVEAEYNRLRLSVFKHRTIGMIHGKMSAQEKNRVMGDFSSGHLDILVSTTVVEVGVDVPNATIMIIEDGDHFGLAQLHQLRGRVGRSELQSYCYIIPSDSSAPSRRLREIEKSDDGFYLAEVDLALRGPGELYGSAQHGALNLQVATLADVKTINRAQAAAKRFIDSGENLLHYKELAQHVKTYQRLTTLN